MATATLAEIRNKVRRLTRSPSENQLSTTNLDQYINTFIAYDMPEELRLFKLHSNANLQLSAYQANYDLTALTTILPDGSGDTETLDNYLININPPVYIDGYKAYFTQSRDEFYNIYPQNQNIVKMGTGDSATVNFSKTISNGYLVPNEVQVSSIDANNNSLYLTDDGAGTLSGDGTGTVDYVTGAIAAVLNTAPGSSELVNAHIVQYTPGRPAGVLYYQDEIIVRPIPDQPYTLNFEVYIEPTQLIASADVPQLKQWWQYIALSAAVKILYDRMDTETVAQIMPELKRQERLVLRRTIVQNATQRVATIYASQAGLGANFGNDYSGF